mgnify:CR=1 FL=1|tara:strand:+ start:2287 stop:2721 length:435 start_codon:yes stop_codon:yes gene_type:complete
MNSATPAAPGSGPRAVNLQAIPDGRGLLCVAECDRHVPFTVKRVFYISGMRSGVARGHHAHREQMQFIICPAGALQLDCQWASGTGSLRLDTPDRGLFVPAMTWLSFRAETDEALCMVLASGPYDESDYIRNADEFKQLLAGAG